MPGAGTNMPTSQLINDSTPVPSGNAIKVIHSPDAVDGGRCPSGRATVTAPGVGSRNAASDGTACPCAISLPTTKNNQPKPSNRPVLTMWPDGSRVDVPGVRYLNPLAKTQPQPSPPKTKRGLVTSFSEKSRRNFLRQLCTLIRDAIPDTMALTLPNEWEQFDLPFLQSAFKKLGERFDAKCSRDSRWAAIALAWKKEPQKRGALHWHLLFYGVESPDLKKQVQAWFADQWNELICAGLDPEERRKHAVWHHHENNWEPVNSVSYFTKYVGKAVEVDATGSTGRWWGFWRKAYLPWATKVQGTITDQVAVDMNRVARKIRQKRGDEAKHKALCKQLELNASPFSPSILKLRPPTAWDLERLRCGYGPDGRHDPAARIWLGIYTDRQIEFNTRLGKYRYKGGKGMPNPDELKIVLTGKHVPDMMLRVAEWSAERHGLMQPKKREGPFRPKLP